MKNVISKNIINIAKLAGEMGKSRFITLYSDGRAMATDSFKIIEVKNAVQEESETLAGLFPEEERFEIKDPLMIPAQALVKKQKFEKFPTIPDLENAILAKGTDDNVVKICTTNLECTVENSFKLSDETPYEYEQIFLKNPEFVGHYTVKFLMELLNELSKMGVREINMLKDSGERGKTYLIAKDVRAAIMPVYTEKSEEEAKDLYNELLKYEQHAAEVEEGASSGSKLSE